jgi:hypothetical protein
MVRHLYSHSSVLLRVRLTSHASSMRLSVGFPTFIAYYFLCYFLLGIRSLRSTSPMRIDLRSRDVVEVVREDIANYMRHDFGHFS